jgi:hypothetical protein
MQIHKNTSFHGLVTEFDMQIHKNAPFHGFVTEFDVQIHKTHLISWICKGFAHDKRVTTATL